MSLKILTGIWAPDTQLFAPNRHIWSQADIDAAQHNIFKTATQLLDTGVYFNNNYEEMCARLGFTHRLLDMTEFNNILQDLKTVYVSQRINKRQYDHYQWLQEVFCHTLPHGAAIWENRTLLLDTEDPADWFTWNMLK